MRHFARAWGLLALARMGYGQTLPYNPTQLALLTNYTTIYLLRPAAQSPNQAQLLTLDFTTTLPASKLPWSTVTETLPFLRDDEAVPYVPTVEADGSITVVTGNCSEGAAGLEIWRYMPRWSKYNPNTWVRMNTSTTALGAQASIAGPQYLASSMAFSEYIDGSTTNVYAFGGMCPTSAASTAVWQSAADYSSSMLTLLPQVDGKMVDGYDAQVLQNQGPPIPQAGMSITPLSPTYSLSSTGTPQTVQQDFVLLGGHTPTAFINMSQVAVFSLPQESWSFMPVQQPVNPKTDLTRRQSVQVTPRSGHTAVLTEDGGSIILFGGWVGDVNTPATPQLAVLKLGDGYGGSGDWKWSVPQDTSSGSSSGAGIYGHGAVMLPGGVMMVVGGYEIPTTATSRTKRTTQIGNSHNLFYNATSNTWLDSYSVPHGFNAGSQSNSGPLSTKSKKVGLGAGLGVGAAILISVVAMYFWYSKRVKRAREDRQRALLLHSSDGSSLGQMEQPFLDTGGIDGRGGDQFALGRFWSVQNQADNGFPRPPPMQHTTGMFVNVPSPTRGLRRGVAGKNYQYQPAPRFDDKRISLAAGSIHPIAEQENEDEVLSLHSDREQLDDAEAKLREIERVLTTADDPFQDAPPNPLGSHPVSPIAGVVDSMRRVPTGASRVSMPTRRAVPGSDDGPNWTVEPGAEDSDGRISPSKSADRTSSTLSERSQRSEVSRGSMTRTMSTRTGAILAAAMASQRKSAGIEISPTHERTGTMSTEASYFNTRARSSTNGSITPGGLDGVTMGDRDSWISTKSTTFAHLQSEGEALLGGRPPADRDDPYQRAIAASSSTARRPKPPPHLATTNNPPLVPPRRRPGWVGSLRRALNVLPVGGDRSFSLTGSMSGYKDDPAITSTSSSPTKEKRTQIGSAPRRAVSDGGALLTHKRGEKDWEEKNPWPPYRDYDDGEDWGEPSRRAEKDVRGGDGGEEEWDVEGAANRRDFQVMFTVPKARLRVVNDDMDRASLRSASEGAVSRSGSVKDLKREESLRALRARLGEAEWPPLPETVEEGKEEGEKVKAA